MSDQVMSTTPPVPKPKTKKKKKKTNPFRPKTRYYFFYQKESSILRENGEKDFGVIAKTLSARWKSLSDEEKKTYEDLATNDKERVAKLITEAEERGDDISEWVRPKKKKSSRSHCVPNPYILWSNHTRPTIAADIPNKTRYLGDTWKALTAEEKQPWRDLYKEKYEASKKLRDQESTQQDA